MVRSPFLTAKEGVGVDGKLAGGTSINLLLLFEKEITDTDSPSYTVHRVPRSFQTSPLSQASVVQHSPQMAEQFSK